MAQPIFSDLIITPNRKQFLNLSLLNSNEITINSTNQVNLIEEDGQKYPTRHNSSESFITNSVTNYGNHPTLHDEDKPDFILPIDLIQ